MWRLLSRAAAMVCAAVVLSGVMTLNIAYSGQRLSGPFTHENLAVYFIHGESAKGPVPLTLDEALATGSARLLETGNVQMLNIENLGDEEVFIQAGDIVKGGRQDRVLSVSLLVPGKSGAVPISAFCIEQGRWSARGREDATRFSSASASLPTLAAKRAMRASSAAPSDGMPVAGRPLTPLTDAERAARAAAIGRAGGLDVNPQSQVWNEVARTQERLSARMGAPVRAAESESSLQLALENRKLKDAQRNYVDALKDKGEAGGDIVGYAVAVNGKIRNAEIYSSNGLFRKMWEKQLAAGATEALSEHNGAAAEAPKLDAVTAFLKDAEQGKPEVQTLAADARLEVRHAPAATLYETQETRGRSQAVMSERRFFHRSVLSRKD
jgi:hypothetical protein